MPDLVDDVQENVNIFNETSLEAQLARSKPKRPYQEGEGEVECKDCGCVIPSERRKHGHILCVDCQTYVEKIDAIKRMRGE